MVASWPLSGHTQELVEHQPHTQRVAFINMRHLHGGIVGTLRNRVAYRPHTARTQLVSNQLRPGPVAYRPYTGQTRLVAHPRSDHTPGWWHTCHTLSMWHIYGPQTWWHTGHSQTRHGGWLASHILATHTQLGANQPQSGPVPYRPQTGHTRLVSSQPHQGSVAYWPMTGHTLLVLKPDTSRASGAPATDWPHKQLVAYCPLSGHTQELVERQPHTQRVAKICATCMVASWPLSGHTQELVEHQPHTQRVA